MKIPLTAIMILTVYAAIPKYHPNLTLKIMGNRAKRKGRKQRSMAQAERAPRPDFGVERFS